MRQVSGVARLVYVLALFGCRGGSDGTATASSADLAGTTRVLVRLVGSGSTFVGGSGTVAVTDGTFFYLWTPSAYVQRVIDGPVEYLPGALHRVPLAGGIAYRDYVDSDEQLAQLVAAIEPVTTDTRDPFARAAEPTRVAYGEGRLFWYDDSGDIRSCGTDGSRCGARHPLPGRYYAITGRPSDLSVVGSADPSMIQVQAGTVYVRPIQERTIYVGLGPGDPYPQPRALSPRGGLTAFSVAASGGQTARVVVPDYHDLFRDSMPYYSAQCGGHALTHFVAPDGAVYFFVNCAKNLDDRALDKSDCAPEDQKYAGYSYLFRIAEGTWGTYASRVWVKPAEGESPKNVIHGSTARVATTAKYVYFAVGGSVSSQRLCRLPLSDLTAAPQCIELSRMDDVRQSLTSDEQDPTNEVVCWFRHTDVRGRRRDERMLDIRCMDEEGWIATVVSAAARGDIHLAHGELVWAGYAPRGRDPSNPYQLVTPWSDYMVTDVPRTLKAIADQPPTLSDTNPDDLLDLGN